VPEAAAGVTRHRCRADADGGGADLAVEIGWLMVDPQREAPYSAVSTP
jgi:hypothetical protein